MRTKFYALLALMVVISTMRAQDIHFSQYYSSPMTLNPALTGKFDGLYRISGIYRGQYYGLDQANSIFRTPAISGDLSLLKDKMKGNALGIGLSFVNDGQSSSGADNTSGKITTNTLALSVGYTLNLNKAKTTQISIGLQPSLSFRKSSGNYEYPQAFNSDLTYNTASSNNETLLQPKKTYFNFDYGLFFNIHPKEWLTFYIGATMANVARPNTDVILSTPDSTNKFGTGKMPFRYMIHGGFEFALNKKFTLIPGFLYQYEGKANEANAGVTLGYTLFDKNKNGKRDKAVLYLGIWNRMGNDVGGPFEYRNITPKIGMDYKNFNVGFAYDIAISDMATAAHNTPGAYRPQAYELAITYIGFAGKALHDNNYLYNPRY